MSSASLKLDRAEAKGRSQLGPENKKDIFKSAHAGSVCEKLLPGLRLIHY